MKFLFLLFEYFRLPRVRIEKGKKYVVFVLCGRWDKNSRDDSRRLSYASKLCKEILASGSQINLYFSGYMERKSQFEKLLSEDDFRVLKVSLLADSSFKSTNTKSQTIDIHKFILANSLKDKDVVIVSDSWHLPRIRRYLRLKSMNCQTYSGSLTVPIRRVIGEVRRLYKYQL